MTTTPSNPPAFPRPASVDPTSGSLTDGDRVVPPQDGLTLRDFFAAAALTGYIAGHAGDNTAFPSDADAARNAYDLADAMLARREMK